MWVSLTINKKEALKKILLFYHFIESIALTKEGVNLKNSRYENHTNVCEFVNKTTTT